MDRNVGIAKREVDGEQSVTRCLLLGFPQPDDNSHNLHYCGNVKRDGLEWAPRMQVTSDMT
jgi:hypothetical protein